MAQSEKRVGRIGVLPEAVQNKIAAGEVVERPASVVKELAENSLDAGARAVTVEIEEGGRALVRVTDDGCGMDETDLALSVERHATSKIRDAEDIFAISTMGFRGEALPSIAAVSRFSLTSAVEGALSGNRLVVEGGRKLRLQPAPPRRGTVVEARDLFFNTPARLKFLKSPAAETAAANDAVERLALAHPEVAFRMLNGGKTVLELPAHASLAERLGAVFGRELAGRLAAVNRDCGDGLAVRGFVALPPESRANSRDLHVFLNGRWIRHAGIARVVRDAYQGLLPPRRYPFAVLCLEIDPARVDVNVHPAKTEVRFADERAAVGAVARAVAESLRSPDNAVVPGAEAVEPPVEIAGAARQSSVDEEPGAAAAEAAVAYERRDPARLRFAPTHGPEKRFHSYPAEFSGVSELPPPGAGGARVASTGVGNTETAAGGTQAELPRMPARRHKVLAQAGARYLVVECAEGIKLVDQHALHERWNYEKLLGREAPVCSQRLLLPVVVELTAREAALLDEALPALRGAGFELEPFGLATVSVSAAPELVKPGDVARVVRDVFADLESAGRAVGSLRERLLASLACRAAVLAGQSLTPEQAQAIMDKFDEAAQPLTCPHGRPTAILLGWDELERRFGRR